jgi:hypothetical protein
MSRFIYNSLELKIHPTIPGRFLGKTEKDRSLKPDKIKIDIQQQRSEALVQRTALGEYKSSSEVGMDEFHPVALRNPGGAILAGIHILAVDLDNKRGIRLPKMFD